MLHPCEIHFAAFSSGQCKKASKFLILTFNQRIEVINRHYHLHAGQHSLTSHYHSRLFSRSAFDFVLAHFSSFTHQVSFSDIWLRIWLVYNIFVCYEIASRRARPHPKHCTRFHSSFYFVFIIFLLELDSQFSTRLCALCSVHLGLFEPKIF